MPKPKISIVVPSYNRAEFIPATIDSILQQSFQDFELIFIDDGSTDNTTQIMKKYTDSDYRVKYFKQVNSERAVARSYGISLATGDFVCLVDSDDLWYPNKLETQLKVMEADPEIVLSYAAVNRIDFDGNRVAAAPRQHQGESGYVFFDLLKRNFIPSVTPMIKADVAKRIGKQVTELIPYEDWDFWLRISREGKFFHIVEPLGDYRIHPGQSVQNVKADHIEKVTMAVLDRNTDPEQANLTKYLEQSMPEEDINSFATQVYPDIKNEAFSLANLRFAYWFLVANKTDIAKQKLFISSTLSPNRANDYRWWGLRVAIWLKPLFGTFITRFLGSFH